MDCIRIHTEHLNHLEFLELMGSISFVPAFSRNDIISSNIGLVTNGCQSFLFVESRFAKIVTDFSLELGIRIHKEPFPKLVSIDGIIYYTEIIPDPFSIFNENIVKFKVL